MRDAKRYQKRAGQHLGGIGHSADKLTRRQNCALALQRPLA
jgi:hypothetical protein